MDPTIIHYPLKNSLESPKKTHEIQLQLHNFPWCPRESGRAALVGVPLIAISVTWGIMLVQFSQDTMALTPCHGRFFMVISW